MLKSGYISFIQESGGGYDSNGNVIDVTKTPTDFIKCNLMVITKEYRTLVHGQYQQANYSVYIDSDKLPVGLDLETINEIQLQDNNANNLGNFQIQNREYLNLTKRVKIVV